MIKTKEDLKKYLKEDLYVNLHINHLTLKNKAKYTLYANESYKVIKLLRALRYHEYYTNQSKIQCNLLKRWKNSLLLRYYSIKHYRLEAKYGIKLGTNVLGYGVYIPHINSSIMIDCISIGNYCSLNAGVVIGRNQTLDQSPVIGNNVTICLGSKIVRKVRIGNNVIVAPNSVVIDNVPDNCMVSGVPAKIVKTNINNRK